LVNVCIFVIMNSIKSFEKKDVLNDNKTSIKINPITLPAHVSDSVKEGIKQYEAGLSISLQEFTLKYLSSN
jgi:hypothetical protein